VSVAQWKYIQANRPAVATKLVEVWLEFTRTLLFVCAKEFTVRVSRCLCQVQVGSLVEVARSLYSSSHPVSLSNSLTVITVNLPYLWEITLEYIEHAYQWHTGNRS
jgi:hypothetical protein